MSTYMETLEDVAQEVSTWAVDIIKHVVEAVSPEGRPFDTELMSTEDQLNEYLNIRGNPDAWLQWISIQELNITEQLFAAQVPEGEIALANPHKLAFAYALKYSSKMEKLLQRRLPANVSNDAG